jgi:hypothetical protein
MDQTEQLYESEATGWQRGLYEDIARTTGFVGSIWRTLMYHEPRFLRYAWGQLAPAFRTREFAALDIALRDTLVSATEPDLPRYTLDDVDLAPGEFAELRGQLRCYDFAIARYAVAFEIMERRLDGRPVGTDPPTEAGTAPVPEWLDPDRGREPKVLPNDEAREIVRGVVPESHSGGFGEMVPTGYRSWARFPSYLERVWADIEPIVDAEAFETAREDAYSLIETYVDRLPYTPQVDPETLAGMGFDEGTVEELWELFATFERGGRRFVPLVPVYAATVDAAGERRALTFP